MQQAHDPEEAERWMLVSKQPEFAPHFETTEEEAAVEAEQAEREVEDFGPYYSGAEGKTP